MKKNRIRLTESQLHKVIKESVKQVLSELDWKTYANAAEKAKERWSNTFDDKKSRQKYRDMWDKFDKASEKTFNDEYGTSKYHYTTDGINNIHHNWDRMMCRPTKHRKVATLSDNGWNESYFDFDPVSNETDGRYWFNNHDFLSGKGDEDEIFDSLGKKVGSEHFNAAKNGNKELKDYHNGNYEYQKIKDKQNK